MQTSRRSISIVLSFAVVAMTASCVDEAGPLEPDVDEEATSVALQELGGQPHAFLPLVRQNTPLGAWLYEQLGKNWLRWAMGLPWSTGPIRDPDGGACDLGQSGPVWNLAGTSFGMPEVTRSCTVPFGKFLFFPLINTWITPPPSFVTETQDEAYWTAFATNYLAGIKGNTCSLTLRLDGHEIPSDPSRRFDETYVDILDPFPVLFNDDHYAGPNYPGGVWPLAYMGGHFALLLPPSPGDHVLEFGGTACNSSGTPTFRTLVHWNLRVE